MLAPFMEKVLAPIREGAIGRAFGQSTETAATQRAEPGNPLLKLGASVQGHGIARGVADFASGLTEPENLAFMAGTGALGAVAPRIISGLVSLGFSADMLRGVYQQVPQFQAAVRQGNWPMAREIATKMALGTAGGVLAGVHGVRGVTPEAKAAEPAGTATITGREPYRPRETPPPEAPKAAPTLSDEDLQRLLRIETNPTKRGKLAVMAHQRGLPIPAMKPGARVPVQTLLEQKSTFEQAQEHEETWQRLFDEAEERSKKLAAKGARTPPVVPESGAADERTTAARDDIARHFTGNPYAAISPEERGVVDDLMKEGYIGAAGGPPPPAPTQRAQSIAAMPPAVRLGKIRDVRKATGMTYKAAAAKVDAEAAPPAPAKKAKKPETPTPTAVQGVAAPAQTVAETPQVTQAPAPVKTPETPTPAEPTAQGGAATPATANAGKQRGDPGWVGNVPTSSLHVDAPRFQFKQNVGQGGAG
jgi:hypothetical protein